MHTAIPTSGQGIDFMYNYASANNGRVQSITDNVTGEQVTYTYDQLNRLIQAASSQNGTMNFAYDGFGNLTQNNQTYLSVDPNTNRINTYGYQYNANGNLTQDTNGTYSYDVANRLTSNGAVYDPRNKRIMDASGNLYLYGESGELLGKYQLNWGQSSSTAYIQGGPSVYFAGRMLADTTQGWVMTDRLGSVRLNSNGERSSYQPYGAEITSTSQNRTKFGTYWRDSAGLDYAMNRYYANGIGGFTAPDPSYLNADLANPGSWNRYPYGLGDPVNNEDPTGLDTITSGPHFFYCTVGAGEGAETVLCAKYTVTVTASPLDPPCPPVPKHPALGPNNANVAANVDDAEEINAALTFLTATNVIDTGAASAMKLAYMLYEFYPGQPMDYKQYDGSMRAFGNFNFGAVAAGLGLSLTGSQWAAGFNSYTTIAVTNLFKYGILKGAPPEFGTPFTGPPHGDSPLEQREIADGYKWANAYMGGGCSNQADYQAPGGK